MNVRPEGDGAPREHHLEVTRTARYHTLGEPGMGVREVWFVCHGYKQLAGRFIKRFAPIAHPTRLIVAPEGLSRFYVDPEDKVHGPGDRVGATWMTREDREAEIHDYVRYLDRLHSAVLSELDPAGVRVVVLGFSQGVHTACRWVILGDVRPSALVLWGAFPPTDLPEEPAVERLGATALTFVAGRSDHYWNDEARARETARMGSWGITFGVHMYDGGHEIDGQALEEIARGLDVV